MFSFYETWLFFLLKFYPSTTDPMRYVHKYQSNRAITELLTINSAEIAADDANRNGHNYCPDIEHNANVNV